MARPSRASAAAAARRISTQAQEDNATPDDHQNTKARPRKRPRQSSPESSGYESTGSTESPDEQDAGDDYDDEIQPVVVTKKARPVKTQFLLEDDGEEAPVAKKRRTAPAKTSKEKEELNRLLFAKHDSLAHEPISVSCRPPERRHRTVYHRPLLLDGAFGRAGRRALLAWYDSVSATRGMPWRKPWLNPVDGTLKGQSGHREALAKRAYEVWISEIMAQQTRIAVVIGYWTRWMERWPTLPDLAQAKPDDVLAAWRGLGYYSRASRIHAAAQVVAKDSQFKGLMPADVATLQARVPGVGRYTAGAISAIVFGRPAAMVDGNVIRVLSRQLGLYVDNNTDKAMVDLLWAAAEALVQAVARDTESDEGEGQIGDEKEPQAKPELSDRPGRWGQALMELGSTVCGPKPDCASCPIWSTCRAYSEGFLAAQSGNSVQSDVPELGDLEDACELCEPFPEDADEVPITKSSSATSQQKKSVAKAKTKQPSKTIRSPFFGSEEDHLSAAANNDVVDKDTIEVIANHAKAFPLRRAKKAVRELDTLVCGIRSADGRYLLQRRPAKGLLAGLWQLPSHDLVSKATPAKAVRRKDAESFVAGVIGCCGCGGNGDCASHCLSAVDDNACKTKAKTKAQTEATTKPRKGQKKGPPMSVVHDLGSVPWLFSHIRQTMHVYLFDVAANSASLPAPPTCCWTTLDEAEDDYSMGTGMRKCLDLVKNAST